jgi:hypothetical protein
MNENKQPNPRTIQNIQVEMEAIADEEDLGTHEDPQSFVYCRNGV